MTTRNSTHAIVLGRGIAGLLAARALSERFDEVTMIDRDGGIPDDTNRPGVPQGRHAHALLASGQRILEQLFPGLTEELAANGAPTGDMLGDTAIHLSGHRLESGPTDLIAISATRPMLERHIHRRVAAIDNVTFAPPADVVGLTTDTPRGPVTGVRLLRRADDSPAETLHADLVIDALGRRSRVPRWLTAIGHDAPEEDRIAIDLRYATRCFSARPDDLGGLLACIHGPWPEQPRGCTLARIENDRWMLTLAGMTGESPPRDGAGFTAFARSLRSREIDQIVDGKTPLDEPALFRFPTSTRRHYERLEDRPSGFLAVGDSLCSLNPVYGQGMSIAAQQAQAILRSPNVSSDDLWPEIIRPVDAAWTVVQAADLAFPGVDGPRRLADRVLGRYIQRLHAAATTEPALSEAFIRVSGLIDPPTRLLAPRVAAQVLTHCVHNTQSPADRLRLRGGLTPARMVAAALVAPTATVAGIVMGRTALRRRDSK